MKKAEEEQTAVALFNSNVKNSSYSSETEVHLHKRSKVMESPRKMCVGNFASSAKKSVKVADIRRIIGCKGGDRSDVQSGRNEGSM